MIELPYKLDEHTSSLVSLADISIIDVRCGSLIKKPEHEWLLYLVDVIDPLSIPLFVLSYLIEPEEPGILVHYIVTDGENYRSLRSFLGPAANHCAFIVVRPDLIIPTKSVIIKAIKSKFKL